MKKIKPTKKLFSQGIPSTDGEFITNGHWLTKKSVFSDERKVCSNDAIDAAFGGVRDGEPSEKAMKEIYNDYVKKCTEIAVVTDTLIELSSGTGMARLIRGRSSADGIVRVHTALINDDYFQGFGRPQIVKLEPRQEDCVMCFDVCGEKLIVMPVHGPLPKPEPYISFAQTDDELALSLAVQVASKKMTVKKMRELLEERGLM